MAGRAGLCFGVVGLIFTAFFTFGATCGRAVAGRCGVEGLEFLVFGGGRRSGGRFLAPLFCPLFFLQVRSDPVEVVGKHSEADVAFEVCFSSVGAAVESVVFEGVDVAFHRAVRVGLFAPLFIALPLAVGLAEFAFFGHDDFGDFEL